MSLALLKHSPISKIDKLREAAKHYDCQICGKHRTYTVGAHCNDMEWKGIGKKSPGFLLAYVCGDPGGCHDLIDGRSGALSKEEKRWMWDLAFKRTVAIWFRDKWLVVA